ncbi:nitroreductase family protein [uncultured Veillonella sp.]|uniref:nitroreductase family protein n=1 Tax=uncultured Veillonella sp. TaxID=159268 RepID=UPI0025E904C0|nr:nitroreductase family protein [uncultured Veillonella sp.]MDY3973246.1 nitroreductase family protein [Veillonella caviae]
MKTLETLQARRTYYNINKEIPVSVEDIVKFVEQATELVPDSFNMKSSRVVVALGEQHDALWDTIYDVFEGKVAREKIDSFKAGYGTVLYFVDQPTVEKLQGQFPIYADRFPHWAAQSAAMLQISVWEGLREMGVGASLQHYNPVINEAVQKLFNLPSNWVLDAQMPFGGIVAEPEAKEKEDISQRVVVKK